jgi:hypothetical protein
LRTLKAMTPKDRVSYIQTKFQKDYRLITTKLAGHDFELIGTKKKPRGVKLKNDDPIIGSILKLKCVDKSLSTGLETKDRETKTVLDEPYFCFKTIFQIQIEGKTNGLQTFEERFILVKADNWDKAEKKVLKAVKAYDEPYLNPMGQLVRWKFESIEESYHTFIATKDDFGSPVEVFSKLKTRKLKKDNIWNGR